MIEYKNLNGNSGVLAFEIGEDYLKIKFRRNLKVYVYDTSRPGLGHLNNMKRLTVAGKGLATYVSQNVRERYARME